MLKYYLYTALSHDTFDSIALDFYNEETLSGNIISANPQYRNTILFSGGEVLQIPVIEVKAAETLPPWKRS
ncbi:LysM domain-containing protein [Paenibacillus psychroresistens]|uniref:LysM domain-containing protein n=1 Tax=Paenibacillus psychroresistens TaxID=1778678 RepID=A0A6B8RNW6_9BACL|nr:LysM domain-containing protein [Paenibacillus psychroresistens]QGQ97056.1 LysM domain-containing protein [Paenibacillus psychroresistens]